MASTMVSGCVKWFNSRHKYGFITVTSDGEYKNVDLFVHQSNINTKEPCYRFLIAGENVKFEVKITNDEKHPSQAVNVSEINGGSLKCELPRQQNQSYQPREDNSTNGGGYRGRGGRGRSDGGESRSFSRSDSRIDSGSFSGRRGGGFTGRGGSRGGNSGGEFGRSRFGVQDRVAVASASASSPSVNTDTA